MNWLKEFEKSIATESITVQMLENLFNSVPTFNEGETSISFFMINKSIRFSKNGEYENALRFAKFSRKSISFLSNTNKSKNNKKRLDMLIARAVYSEIIASLGLKDMDSIYQGIVELYELVFLSETNFDFFQQEEESIVNIEKDTIQDIKNKNLLIVYDWLYKEVSYKYLIQYIPITTKYLPRPSLLKNSSL